MVLEAQRRFELVAQRATPDTITTSVEHARALYLTANPELDAKFHEAAEALAVDGTNAADTRRAWALLRDRVHDDQVSARLAKISERLVLGATSGGEVSAATLAFRDESFLILMDHGLANLTWLIAQLFVVSRTTPLLGHPPPDDPVDAMVAAQTLRLATARISGGGRAGVNPSLVLVGDELALAGALVSEIDIFVMAHEAAHILLGHFGDDRMSLGVVGGSNQLLGRRPREETSADLLAITLQLDDLLSVGEADSRIVELRVVAVRLFLALLDLYEKSLFVVQPTSHPPAAERWRDVVSQRLVHWFDNVDELERYGSELIAALRDLDAKPRLTDAADVHRGLGRRLDRRLWSFYDWGQAAALGHLLIPSPAESLDALRRWPGWAHESDIEAEVGELVATVLASDPARKIMRSAVTGAEAVSRLTAATALTSEVEATRGGAADHAVPFPSWAVAAIALSAITETISSR